MNMLETMVEEDRLKRQKLCDYIMNHATTETVDEWMECIHQEQRILCPSLLPPPEPSVTHEDAVLRTHEDAVLRRHEDAVLKFIQPWMTYLYYNYSTSELQQALRTLR